MWTDENRARYDRAGLRYPSDLTDTEWAEIGPLLPPARPGGNKRTVDIRAVTAISGGSQVGVHEGLYRHPVRRQRRTGVEPEPPEPQDPGTEQGEGQGVREHRVARPAPPLPDQQHNGQRRNTGVDVHDGATGEVERADPEQPARGREDPVRDRRVDEDRPESEEPCPGREPHAVRDRPGEIGRSHV